MVTRGFRCMDWKAIQTRTNLYGSPKLTLEKVLTTVNCVNQTVQYPTEISVYYLGSLVEEADIGRRYQGSHRMFYDCQKYHYTMYTVGC